LDCGDDYFIVNDFLQDILLQTPPQSLMYSESENNYITVNVNRGVEVVGNMVKSNSSNSIVSQQQHGLKSKKVPRKSSSPKTYILSFDNSTMIPAATPNYKNKRNHESTEMKINQQINGVKKGRSSSQCIDHIMAERKRRQELSEKFIALSATIPGLSKVNS